MTVHRIDWDTTDWTDVREGVFRKAFSGDGATLALHRLEPGHKPMPHAHPYEQIVYIMDGEMDFHVGDEVCRVQAGQLIVIPANVMHHGVVVGNKAAINLDVFTPRRAEYA